MVTHCGTPSIAGAVFCTSSLSQTPLAGASLSSSLVGMITNHVVVTQVVDRLESKPVVCNKRNRREVVHSRVAHGRKLV